jgi:hypothetical protein
MDMGRAGTGKVGTDRDKDRDMNRDRNSEKFMQMGLKPQRNLFRGV